MVEVPGKIRLRLFGLRGPKMSRIEEEAFPFLPNLTVGRVWGELQRGADPHAPLASLQRDMVLVLVNGSPVHRLSEGWDTLLKIGDTVTFMVKAFGG
jgi:molybdopterin converting factor small subunit